MDKVHFVYGQITMKWFNKGESGAYRFGKANARAAPTVSGKQRRERRPPFRETDLGEACAAIFSQPNALKRMKTKLE